jgi:hypothetical protein
MGEDIKKHSFIADAEPCEIRLCLAVLSSHLLGGVLVLLQRTLTAMTRHAVKYNTYSVKQVAERGQVFPSDLTGDRH